jgi:MFS family permease
VSSYDALGSFVAMPLGSVAFGLLADRFDPEVVLVVSGIVYAALALGTLASRSVRNLRNEPVASPA